MEIDEDTKAAQDFRDEAASGTRVPLADVAKAGSYAGNSSAEADPGALFPVIGLGASAGGLEALRRLLGLLPTDMGAALVVIQHLDPDRPSLLPSVLAGTTRLVVVEAASGMRVEPNRIYVIPPGADLSIHGGVLTLGPRRVTRRLHLPIDSFFRALAADRRRQAIGVVLSGSGADGTEGLRAIKAEGGVAIAQSPESAQFRSMPESALAAGVVDFAAPPEGIAHEIERLAGHPYLVGPPLAEIAEIGSDRVDDETGLDSVLGIVRLESGIDFSGYKRATVQRRVERRMALRRSTSLTEYAEALRSDSVEVRSMARDMLIHVTAFFRDPEAFEALAEHVFRELVRRRSEGSSIRIWVPGCSTGEEVYSVAICLLEALDDGRHSFSVKIFGSDLSEEAVDAARAGFYSDSALSEVSPARLARFFDRVEGGYRIGKRIRDLCVFVRHDLTRDPPFAKLDLICCRNVLIYLDADLQRRIVPMLHFCIGQPGYLFLGQSEAISAFRDLFAPLDKENRLFIKTGESPRVSRPLTSGRELDGPLAGFRLRAAAVDPGGAATGRLLAAGPVRAPWRPRERAHGDHPVPGTHWRVSRAASGTAGRPRSADGTRGTRRPSAGRVRASQGAVRDRASEESAHGDGRRDPIDRPGGRTAGEPLGRLGTLLPDPVPRAERRRRRDRGEPCCRATATRRRRDSRGSGENSSRPKTMSDRSSPNTRGRPTRWPPPTRS